MYFVQKFILLFTKVLIQRAVSVFLVDKILKHLFISFNSHEIKIQSHTIIISNCGFSLYLYTLLGHPFSF